MKKSEVKVICKKYGISYKKLNKLFIGVQNMDELTLLQNCFIAGDKVFKIKGYDGCFVIHKHPKKVLRFANRMCDLQDKVLKEAYNFAEDNSK